jgi:lipopolysaccharide/colanic/teichoic acid biosynthesis glycosyltransferase
VKDKPEKWTPSRHTVYPKHTKKQGSVHLAEELHAILEREKARADRNAHQFSFIIFNLNNKTAGGSSFQASSLTNILVNRIRWTDEAGWFDNKCLCVVLPDTSNIGARKFADSVLQMLSAKSDTPDYTIYTYPSESFPGGNGHSKQLRFKDICPQWERGTLEDYSTLADNDEPDRDSIDKKVLMDDTALGDITLEAESNLPFFQPGPIWKRAFDILGSIAALIILSPLFVFVSLLIKAVSKGPVFFKQQRIGYKGKPFIMLKFRTMKVNADAAEHKEYVTKLINGAKNGDADKPMTKLSSHRERIRFGRILRKMCIDELPQLFNVLRGDMSLVGPRPALSYEVEEYLSWHYDRFNAIPGMTGLWQVSGKNRLSFNEMVRLDIRYSRELSFGLDVKILLKTPFAIISQIIDDTERAKAMNLRGVEKCLTLRL